MKTTEQIKQLPRLSVQMITADGGMGWVDMGNWQGSIIWSIGGGWDHVSVSPYKKRIVPSWDDMCRIKDMFFLPEEWVSEFHPAKSEYVNNMPNCLHLWRCQAGSPIPPSVLTGIKDGQKLYEVLEEVMKIEQ